MTSCKSFQIGLDYHIMAKWGWKKAVAKLLHSIKLDVVLMYTLGKKALHTSTITLVKPVPQYFHPEITK